MLELEIGQAWVCEPLADTPSLLFVVGRIDDPLEINPAFRGDSSVRIVSVSVTPHPKNKAERWPPVMHIPVDLNAFGKSGERLVREGLEPSEKFEDGYEIWKAGFANGDAIVFTLPVPEAYRAIVQIVDGSPLADRA